MIIKATWLTGHLNLECDKVFPAKVDVAKQYYAMMAKDYTQDYEDFETWLCDKIVEYKCLSATMTQQAEELKAKEFFNGMWYGDCVANEKRYKLLLKEAKSANTTADKFIRNYEQFKKIFRR